MRILVALVALCLLIVAVAAFPLVYNHHVFPLGRLAKSIRAGDRFEKVREKMRAYYWTYGVERPVQFSESGGLHLYDGSCFDDLELSVHFDAQGRVSETSFSGD